MATDNRKIVAIMFSDVVGFAHVTDPEKTAPIVHDQETRNLVSALTQKYEGECVQDVGNAVVCVFGSVVAAMRCALEIQHGMAKEDEFRPRIGIHCLAARKADLGSDEFAGAVHIAARIQELSEGGICITGRAHEELRSNQALLDFDDLGETPLENVSVSVRVYRVRLPAQPVTLTEFESVGERSPEQRSIPPMIWITAAVLLALAVGWQLLRAAPEGAAPVTTAIETAEPVGTETQTEIVVDSPPVAEVAVELSESEFRAMAFATVREKLLGIRGGSQFAPRVWTIPDPVKDNTVYRVGIEANCSCTAMLFSIDGSADEISLLYPNPFHTDGSIQAGEVLKIPESTEFFLRAVGGEGIDEMKLVVIDGPLTLPIAPGEVWSATPEQKDRIAELEVFLDTLATLEWDSATAPLQIIP